jgi:GNAT superfamily N-acetyltransferase
VTSTRPLEKREIAIKIDDRITTAAQKFFRSLPLRLDYIYRIDLTNQLVHWKTRVPVIISVGTLQDVASAAELHYREAKIDDRSLFKSQFESGHKCFVAKVGSSVVGYDWIGFGSFWNGIDYVVLRDNEVFCFDAYTALEWRGEGVHTALLAAILEWARKENYQAAYTHVAVLQPSSWKSHERLKWQVSGLLTGAYLPGFDKHWSYVVYGSRYPIQHTDFSSRKAAIVK